MEWSHWYLVIGALLLLMGLLGSYVARLPVTAAMLYLGIGALFHLIGWIELDVVRHAPVIERLSELAVLISLFSAGLKLRVPFRWRLWRLPLVLALAAMTVTVGLIALAGLLLLGLPLGAAVVLGAVLAPTDPVLASDVKVVDVRDGDPVRVALTGEAGLNDGTAFPFLLMGLALSGADGWSPGHWLAVDVLWRLLGAVACGALLGGAIGRLVLHLRRAHHEAVGLDDFLALGLIAATYGCAQLIHVYGFVAVFAAGLALRFVERSRTGPAPPPDVSAVAASDQELATHEQHAAAYMADAVLRFGDQLEDIAELTLVLLAGALLAALAPDSGALLFALLLLFVIRPLAVLPFCPVGRLNRTQAALVAWFGVRGIGSIYYLAYAVTHGLDEDSARQIGGVCLVAIAVSVLLHGLTGTSLMRRYAGSRAARRV